MMSGLQPKKIIIFGAGAEGRKALAFYGPERVRCFVDNSPRKQGALYEGKPVISLAKLRALPADYQLTLALAPANAQEVIPQLTQAGIKEYEIFSNVLFYAQPHDPAPALTKFKDLYQGRRCFIIGNGPSLRLADVETLAAGGEITFACNKIFKAFAHTNWRPDLYCIIDHYTLSYYFDAIINLKLPLMLLADRVKKFCQDDARALDKENIHIFKIYHQYFRDRRWGCLMPGFSPDPAKYTFDGRSVTYAMLQWGAYMGFREMYLLGVDFDYKDPSGGNAGRLDYFCPDYVEPGEATSAATVDIMDVVRRAYQQAAAYAEKNGIKIYNATRGGKLEVFERVDFDELTAGLAAGKKER
jgi:hypothetical protein